MLHPAFRFMTLLLLAGALLGASGEAQQSSSLRVFLRGGPKTHGPDEHDHPRFVEDWTQLLSGRGATVDGSLEFPTSAQLAQTDVLVMYAAEGGSIHGEQRANLEAYLARGGGLVVLHDAVCGDDAHWFKTVVGGAWEHGHSKWHTGPIGLYFPDEEHPITRDLPHFLLEDEIYHELHLDPAAHVIAQSFHTVFDVTPQAWTFEKDDYRAFVSLQGHYTKTFEHPAWRALVLRGIAWAGKRDADLFVSADEQAGLRYPPGGPTAPEVADHGFDIHPDFSSKLVAAEPLVINPISLDWDRDGRMWVALTPGYPYKEKFSGIPAHDQVVILEDTNKDGRMDQRKVFFEGLDLVTSLVFYKDGVIVSAAPEILWLRDTDGDDVCDERVVLYDGFGYGDTHAVLSNMRWGMDGWIYATQGYSGGASRDIKGEGGEFGHLPNGLIRFRPDGSAAELVSSYGSNTWGLDFREDGELFFTMANGSHLRHVVLEEPYLASARVGGVNSWKHIPDHGDVRPVSADTWSVYKQIDFVGAFTAAAGCLVYGGGAWPSEYYTDHFVCEPTVNLIHRDTLHRDGVSFQARRPAREREFLASTDLWFRPVHLRSGPDGAMYVLDFYNQAIVHNDTRGPNHGPTNAAIRPDRDRRHGRIWGVQHWTAEGVYRKPLKWDSSADMLVALASQDSWLRNTAHRLILESGDSALVPQLTTLLMDSNSALTRLHAAWLIDALAASDETRVTAAAHALGDSDPRVRKNAARIIAARGLKSAELHAALMEMSQREQDRTRLAAFLALSRQDLSTGETEQLIRTFNVLTEDWSRSALMAALGARPSTSLTSAFVAGIPGVPEQLARIVSRRADPEAAARFVAALATAPEDSHVQVAGSLRALDLGPGFHPAASDGTRVHIEALLAHSELDVAIAALPLADHIFGDELGSIGALGERLLTVLRDEESSYGDCLTSLRSLLGARQQRSAAIVEAQQLLLASVPLDVQIETIGLLAGVAENEAGVLLAQTIPGLSTSARDAAFEALFQRPNWIPLLLTAIDSGDMRRADLGPHRIHRLRHHPDAQLAARAIDVLDRNTKVADGTFQERLERLLPIVSAPGDPVFGHKLFLQNCGTCHTFKGEGAHIGPDLTGMGAHGIEELLPVVLDPNREVDPAYLEYVITTQDGRLITGVVVRETPEEVVLRSTNGDATIARSEMESMRSTGLSPMPTGLEDLGAEVLRDVFAYLREDYQGYRILDLGAVASSNSFQGMYGPERDNTHYEFKRHGVHDVDGVPFDIVDPDTAPSGYNVLVLRGGPGPEWHSNKVAQRVEIPVGAAVSAIHVLGGVAGWGHPWGSVRDADAVRWTWRYADGSEESHVLKDGDVFADWIGRRDVPGSDFVPDLLKPGTWGQVRRFSMRPERNDVVASLVLESFDNHIAPTFLALTAELPGVPQPAEPEQRNVDHLILGGGSSHDFDRWFKTADLATLGESDALRRSYTDRPDDLLSAGDRLRILTLCTNQSLSAEVRKKVIEHVRSGYGLFVMHPGVWRNWADWDEYHDLIAAASTSHEALREFEVQVLVKDHPMTRGLPATFRIVDELYRLEVTEHALVLAEGVSLDTGERYPVLWTVPNLPAGRILGTTLGHDGRAHEHAAFKTMLKNGAGWLEGK